ncbi:MAG: nucleoside-diphosphate-sugar epimerase, partial [Porticoccaceae bacterium]
DPLEKFRRSNVAGSLRLAQQASQAGVRRIVFISSIKVNGESTRPGQPFTAVDLPAPEDPYAISKHEAEVALQRFAKTCDLEITIIRPPLVYGPGVKANFLGLLQLACSGYPLPFGSVHNRRSFIFLDNLVDLIEICLDHPEAANQVFLASDDDDISLTDLLTRIGRLRQIKLRLISCPTGLLYSLMTILGKRRLQKRLLGNLQVDISKTRSLLGWRPLESLESGLIKTLDNYSG